MLFIINDLVIDSDCRELRSPAGAVSVEPQVFDVLVHLIENRDRVVSKDDLIASIWKGRIVSDSTIDSRINAARKAIGDSGGKQALIRTFSRKGVRFVGAVRVEDAKAAEGYPNVSRPEKPSIAVLPFVCIGQESEQDPFCDGIADEIIAALSRVRWFFVIARGSSFAYKKSGADPAEAASRLGVRYVLTGTVRKASAKIRVATRLIDANNGSTVWAATYDRALADIFAVEDDITQAIVGAIEPALSRAERDRARIRPRDSVDAWSIYQRGMFHLYRYTSEDLAEARALFEQAIGIDPELGSAYSGIAEAYYYEVLYGYAKSADANRERAIGPAQQAVALDGSDAGAHCTLGRIRYLRRDYAGAISELELAIEINPSLALAHYSLGAALVFSGQPQDGFPHLEVAARLSPQDPNMGSVLVRMAEAKYLAGDDDAAVRFGLRALTQPGLRWLHYTILIAAFGQLGRGDEARTYLAEVRRRHPDFSIAFVRAMHPFSQDMGADRYYEGLRKVDVPESGPSAALANVTFR